MNVLYLQSLDLESSPDENAITFECIATLTCEIRFNVQVCGYGDVTMTLKSKAISHDFNLATKQAIKNFIEKKFSFKEVAWDHNAFGKKLSGKIDKVVNQIPNFDEYLKEFFNDKKIENDLHRLSD